MKATKNTVPFTKEDIMFYIESPKYVIGVLNQIEDILFGVQIYPVTGGCWTSHIDTVTDAYKKGLIDFTQDCNLVD